MDGTTTTANCDAKPITNSDIKVEIKPQNYEQALGTEPAPPRRRGECTPRSIIIMIASFLCNGLIFGNINSYSVVYDDLNVRLKAIGDEQAASKASLVGSLAIGMTFLVSPIAGILVDKLGIRLTTFLGGLLAASGMFLASVVVDSVVGLCMTYGILFGVGASLAYTPSLVVLGHYFSTYLGFVNGFVTAGSSVFTIAMPFVLDFLLKTIGLDGCLQAIGGLMSCLMLCGLLFKPTRLEGAEGATVLVADHAATQRRSLGKRVRGVLNVSIWKNRKYVIWAVSVPVALFGYFVPYVHMVTLVKNNVPGNDGKILVLCMGATSGVGRLIFGKIADIPKVNRILLQQISFVSIGLLTMFLPMVHDFYVMIVISLAMGLFDGCFISLLGPIAFEFCGQKGASQAIGFLLGLCSIPLTVGPPIAGLIYDHTGSYVIPYAIAGVPPIIGAVMLCLVRCVKSEETVSQDAEHAITTDSKPSLANGDCHHDSNSTLPPPSYKEAMTEDPAETVPLTSTKTDEEDLQPDGEAETQLNGEIEADEEEAETSLLSEITKAIVLPVGTGSGT